MENNCFHCKFFNQDKGSARCFNPKQKDEDLIQYVYWNFSCGLIEKGERLSDSQMKELGYKKTKQELKSIDGKDLSYYYYQKK